MNRRSFISIGGASLLASGINLAQANQEESRSSAPDHLSDFDFVFFTDTHIQPELDAAKRCAMCFDKLRTSGADFAIQGGDHVFDGTKTKVERAEALWDLYAMTEKTLQMPVHHVIGNHDLVGIYEQSGLSLEDPREGKRAYRQRVGDTYYSFDHKGYHFIVLDSIQPTADRQWEAIIDQEQIAWLAADLAKLHPGTPIVVAVHCPLTTGAMAYSAHDMSKPPKYQQAFVSNAYQVIALLEKHNVLVVLQGHIHINETVTFKGIPFVTCGAVCGDWWRGSHWGTPEGYTTVSLRDGKASWRYETYGFKTISPRND
ncbi:metallophosphoesterase family protein [Silvibacterium acidisoli]|uniref:metallophosphoesterase family protein n=1 Tax=Acidobacteriaceae bacterium ZG23-2 TaxID=2883246 RepID=UPI00406C45FF